MLHMPLSNYFRDSALGRLGRRVLRYAQIPGLLHLAILGCMEPVWARSEDVEPPAGYFFTRAREDELDEMAGCVGNDPATRAQLAELYRRFYAAGHQCAIVRTQDRMIGHLWAFSREYIVTIDDYKKTNLPFELDSNSVFTGNAFVAPEHRNRGVFQHLKLFLMREYPAKTRFYTWVDQTNTPSLAANRALGFEQLAVLRFAGPVSHSFLSLREASARAWTHFGRHWPRLRLDGRHLLSSTPR